jgi:hypothetical protein
MFSHTHGAECAHSKRKSFELLCGFALLFCDKAIREGRSVDSSLYLQRLLCEVFEEEEFRAF